MRFSAIQAVNCWDTLPLPLVQSRSRNSIRPRARRQKQRPATPLFERVDAATLASQLQLQEQRRDVIYSFLALAMKLGLLVIGCASLLKLGLAYYQRVDRHGELYSVLDVESAKLISLQKRFDRLFTIGGERRLMDEQDQWIAPNRVRVIWR